jgi:hypothetical protein
VFVLVFSLCRVQPEAALALIVFLLPPGRCAYVVRNQFDIAFGRVGFVLVSLWVCVYLRVGVCVCVFVGACVCERESCNLGVIEWESECVRA